MQHNREAEFDRYSKSYDQAVNSAISFSGLKVDFFTQAKVDYIDQLISRYLHGAASPNILDVGCGVGNTLSLLANKYPRLAGVDVSSECISAARERMPNVDFATYDGIHLPHPDGSFDLAFAICVFHHVALADRAPLVRDMKRVLRAGGLVAIFEHNPWNPVTRHIVRSCEFDADARLLRSKEAESLMQAAGFNNVFSRFILTVPAAGTLLHLLDQAFSRAPFGAQYYTLGRL
jgi:ubiquinone/menaquinone biosynthesis C-methylase UbiE